jgi:hypothetical protein
MRLLLGLNILIDPGKERLHPGGVARIAKASDAFTLHTMVLGGFFGWVFALGPLGGYPNSYFALRAAVALPILKRSAELFTE